MKLSWVWVFVAILWPACVWADIIEIKEKGFLNGRIVSQDDKEVTFRDAKDRVHVVPREEIIFLEREEEKPKVETWKQRWMTVFNKIKARLMRPAVPLPRLPPAASAAKAPAHGLTAAVLMGQDTAAMDMLDAAGQAQALMQVQQVKMKQALRDSGYDPDAGTASAEQVYDAHQGRFGTLSEKKEE